MSISGFQPECRICTEESYPVVLFSECVRCGEDQDCYGQWTGSGWSLRGFGHWIKAEGHVCHKCIFKAQDAKKK